MLYGPQRCPVGPAARSQTRRRNGSPDRVPSHGWNELMSAVRTLATNDTATRRHPADRPPAAAAAARIETRPWQLTLPDH